VLDSSAVGITQIIAHAVGKSILCSEGRRRGSFQINSSNPPQNHPSPSVLLHPPTSLYNVLSNQNIFTFNMSKPCESIFPNHSVTHSNDNKIWQTKPKQNTLCTSVLSLALLVSVQLNHACSKRLKCSYL